MAINTPYVSVDEANALLEDCSAWWDASDEQQSLALQMGRAYIDANYTCYYSEESGNEPPDAMKVANANLACSYLTDQNLFFGNPSQTGITKNRVKAGSVESEKEFDTYLRGDTDFHPQVTLTLTGVCVLNSSSTNYMTR